MSSHNPFRLHSISIVLTAEYHNPSILNSDFLKHQKIVPSSWKPKETVSTPGYSTVVYSNGVRWVVEQEKMAISEPKNGEFGGKTLVPQIVSKYVGNLPYVPYQNIGLNCQVSMQKTDATDWLKQRFLKPGKWQQGTPKILEASIKLSLEAESAKCNLTIDSGILHARGADPETAVLIDCNFHFAGPLKVREIQNIVRTWPAREKFVLSALTKFLTGQLR